jgi:glucokinase
MHNAINAFLPVFRADIRPPRKERLNLMAKKSTAGYRVGIDLGGTKILAAVVDGNGDIVAMSKKKTKGDLGPDAVIKRIGETASEALDNAKINQKALVGVGIGAPAPVDCQTGVVYSAPNLSGWDEIPLGARLREMFGVPVQVDNDVNLGTLGEFSLGAGRGCRHMVGIFVGTGVGGGVVIDGKLHRGFRYAAGEVGHMIVQPNGPLCGCGRRGCLEAFASRTAIERAVRAGLAEGRASMVTDLMRAEKDRLTSGIIRQALDAGDVLMMEAIGQAQFYLGLLVANLVNALDPEMVVFGGGVVEALGDVFLQPVRETALNYYLQQRNADRIKIVPATLGDNAGVLGGAALVAPFAARKA